ncbi:response regulator [Polaromonas sp.]|uniref:response regulator n=1 Tax=Polaromonas sp. TaxID=1869339 RepID=UPI0032674DCF
MPSTTLALYLQTQRAQYAAELPKKIAALESALRQLGGAGGPSGEEAALSALAQAHQLTGSGGTFGFPLVSQAAADIEKVLSLRAGAPGFPDEAARAAIGAGLQQMKAALAAGQPATEAEAVLPDANANGGTASRSARATRLLHIIEANQPAAFQLAEQLSHSGYQSRIFAHSSAAHLAAAQVAPAAILANIGFSADPLLALHTASASTPDGGARNQLIFMGGGTDFQTRLQAVRAGAAGYFPQPLDVSAMASLLDQLTSAEPTRPYRVLLVEDDEGLATFYANVLQSAGMETRIVTEPHRVMAALLEFQPDLITCDLHMPQCNGIELATLIRQQPEFLRIPIVFLSAETSLDKQAQALGQGGDDFIIKPVTPAALVSAAQSRARRYRKLLAAEDTLRISEERFRLVFESSLDGFLQGLADGTVVSANPAACAMLRMSEQQIRAAGIAGLVDTADSRVAAMLTQTGGRGELSCVRGDGTRFPVEVSSSRHVSSNGAVQVSVVLRDITERKLAERQIMQLNAELESRVEKRTAELTAANQELQAFSHALAHDLRQPYIAINGMTRLLEREIAAAVNERGKHYLQRIRAGVNQMNERTDSLLALAQLSRMQLYREQVDLGAMAGMVLETLQQQDPARSVTTRVQAVPAVQADAGLLLHLLNILLGNAWKFTSWQARAEITVGAEPDPNGEMVFFVKDNGDGFDMSYVDKLFTAFQRLHAPGEFAGAGIGLATARRIVMRHGGRIWAMSAPGEGASFYFTLADGAS